MIDEGKIVLFKFPSADASDDKLRPTLVLRKLSGPHDDWLICMISSRLSQQVPAFDEVIDFQSLDWEQSGLKMKSVIRIGRVAVVHESILKGAIGEVEAGRLIRIKSRLADWLVGW